MEEEAFEDDNVIVDDIQEEVDGDSEDEVEGDDLMDNMEQDYEANPVLDNYEAIGIDEDDQIELSMN
jgi:DNA replication licensing factor MCM2